MTRSGIFIRFIILLKQEDNTEFLSFLFSAHIFVFLFFSLMASIRAAAINSLFYSVLFFVISQTKFMTDFLFIIIIIYLVFFLFFRFLIITPISRSWLPDTRFPLPYIKRILLHRTSFSSISSFPSSGNLTL